MRFVFTHIDCGNSVFLDQVEILFEIRELPTAKSRGVQHKARPSEGVVKRVVVDHAWRNHEGHRAEE